MFIGGYKVKNLDRASTLNTIDWYKEVIDATILAIDKNIEHKSDVINEVNISSILTVITLILILVTSLILIFL